MTNKVNICTQKATTLSGGKHSIMIPPEKGSFNEGDELLVNGNIFAVVTHVDSDKHAVLHIKKEE